MNIRGYLRWQFQGALTSPTFYGFALVILGIIAAVMGCPKPWPWTMCVIGSVLTIVDAARSWFRFSYGVYEMERNRIERELQRKER